MTQPDPTQGTVYVSYWQHTVLGPMVMVQQLLNDCDRLPREQGYPPQIPSVKLGQLLDVQGE